MQYFSFYNIIIKKDLINKFTYSKTKKLPRIEKVVLNFDCHPRTLKQLATNCLALELISKKPPQLTTIKKPNLRLKIKKGELCGCKVILKKISVIHFIETLSFEVLNLNKMSYFKLNKKSSKEATITIAHTLQFFGLAHHYQLFNKMDNLNITIITTTQSNTELQFLLKSLKLPVNNHV